MLLLLAPEGFWRTRERQAGVAGEREERERLFVALRALQRAQAERRLKLKVNLNFAV